jgi:hypothetical protein
LASAILEKFGGDAMEEIRENLAAYQRHVHGF